MIVAQNDDDDNKVDHNNDAECVKGNTTVRKTDLGRPWTNHDLKIFLMLKI